MTDIIGRVFEFETRVFRDNSDLYGKLATQGQSPKALMISCADSRVVPEQIMQAQPGDLFVCRNAGNIVPPFGQTNGGVTATVEYAVQVLGVTEIIVCGHSDCGAMKGLMNPSSVASMPSVAGWLRHAHAAHEVVSASYPDLDSAEAVRAASLENVSLQLAHLRTHPSVATAIARGTLALHGWFVDIHAGVMLGLDGGTGRFVPLREDAPLPVALPAAKRLAADFLPTDAAVA